MLIHVYYVFPYITNYISMNLPTNHYQNILHASIHKINRQTPICNYKNINIYALFLSTLNHRHNTTL